MKPKKIFNKQVLEKLISEKEDGKPLTINGYVIKDYELNVDGSMLVYKDDKYLNPEIVFSNCEILTLAIRIAKGEPRITGVNVTVRNCQVEEIRFSDEQKSRLSAHSVGNGHPEIPWKLNIFLEGMDAHLDIEQCRSNNGAPFNTAIHAMNYGYSRNRLIKFKRGRYSPENRLGETLRVRLGSLYADIRSEFGEFGATLIRCNGALHVTGTGQIKVSNSDMSIIAVTNVPLTENHPLSSVEIKDTSVSGLHVENTAMLGICSTVAEETTISNVSGGRINNSSLGKCEMRNCRIDIRETKRDHERYPQAGDGISVLDTSLAGVKFIDTYIPSAKEWLDKHLYHDAIGYYALKTFGVFFPARVEWIPLVPGKIISEVCINPDRATQCGTGISIGTETWVREWLSDRYWDIIWVVRVRNEWLADIVVPFQTDGKIRTRTLELLTPLSKEEARDLMRTNYLDKELVPLLVKRYNTVYTREVE